MTKELPMMKEILSPFSYIKCRLKCRSCGHEFENEVAYFPPFYPYGFADDTTICICPNCSNIKPSYSLDNLKTMDILERGI